MSKISTALRAAALGPAPRLSDRTISWFGDDINNPAFEALYDFWMLDALEWEGWRTQMSDIERRMFLLFVAEAEE